MAQQNASWRKFVKTLEGYGCTVEHSSKHAAIRFNGARIATVATTGELNTFRQAVRQIAQQHPEVFGADAGKVKAMKFS